MKFFDWRNWESETWLGIRSRFERRLADNCCEFAFHELQPTYDTSYLLDIQTDPDLQLKDSEVELLPLGRTFLVISEIDKKPICAMIKFIFDLSKLSRDGDELSLSAKPGPDFIFREIQNTKRIIEEYTENAISINQLKTVICGNFEIELSSAVNITPQINGNAQTYRVCGNQHWEDAAQWIYPQPDKIVTTRIKEFLEKSILSIVPLNEISKLFGDEVNILNFLHDDPNLTIENFKNQKFVMFKTDDDALKENCLELCVLKMERDNLKNRIDNMEKQQNQDRIQSEIGVDTTCFINKSLVEDLINELKQVEIKISAHLNNRSWAKSKIHGDYLAKVKPIFSTDEMNGTLQLIDKVKQERNFVKSVFKKINIADSNF